MVRLIRSSGLWELVPGTTGGGVENGDEWPAAIPQPMAFPRSQPQGGWRTDAPAPGPTAPGRGRPRQGTRRAPRAGAAGPRASEAERPAVEPARPAPRRPRRRSRAGSSRREFLASFPFCLRASATRAPAAGAKTAPMSPKISSSRPAQEVATRTKAPRPVSQIQDDRRMPGQCAENRWAAVPTA